MGKIEDAVANMIANMKANTGKSLEEWLKITAQAKLTTHGEIVKMLKADHGLGHGFANLVANRTLSGGAAPIEGDDLLAAQYAGPKAELKLLYDKLAKLISAFGKDVEFSPKKTYVSLRRSKQFGLIQPSTATRLDLGLNLRGRDHVRRAPSNFRYRCACDTSNHASVDVFGNRHLRVR